MIRQASACVALISCTFANALGAPVDVTIRVAATTEAGSGAATSSLGEVVGPVASLDEAVALARRIRRERHRPVAIEIRLAPGIHRIDKPVMLDERDSGTSENPLIIRGDPDGGSILTGSVALSPETTGLADYPRLDRAARRNVRVYRLPPHLSAARPIDTARPKSVSVLIERFAPNWMPNLAFEVFDREGALVPARWPNTGWGRVVGPGPDSWWTLQSDAPRLEAWRGEPDMWAAGFWKYDYSYERQHVSDVGPHTLSLATPFVFGVKTGARYRVYHALAELDVPGEWYRDSSTNRLLAWPRGSDSKIEVSVAESALVTNHASHITLADLTIEHFFGDGVRVVAGKDVNIERSTIRWTGLHGASFLDGDHSGIANSDIHDIGEGGVLLSGGDRRNLAPARLFVRNCKIERFARIALTFKPAIDLMGVGNTASGNYISGSASLAVQIQGNDQIVEGNEITAVVDDSNDMGAIYTGLDWTARGNVIRGNYIHDISGRRAGFDTKGVYIDDFSSGDTVSGNLFLRVQQPVFIGGGRDNNVEGNLIIASAPAVHIDSRGLDWAAKEVTNPDSDLRKGLAAMPIDREPWLSRYPQLSGVLGDEPAVAKRNISRGNAFVASRSYYLETKAELDKQVLGPDLGAGERRFPARRGTAEASAKAKSAAEVGAILATELAAAGGPILPFETMDKSKTAGREAAPRR